jgi:hypothetical protein
MLGTGLLAASLFAGAPVFAQDAAEWLQRAAYRAHAQLRRHCR